MDTTKESRDTAEKRRAQPGQRQDTSRRNGDASQQRQNRSAEQTDRRPRGSEQTAQNPRPRQQDAPERRERSQERRSAQTRKTSGAGQSAPSRRETEPGKTAGRPRTGGQKPPQTRQRSASEPAARQRKSTASRRPVQDDVPDRKRAYGNSKPKKKSALTMASEAFSAAKQKRASRSSATGRKKKRASAPTPAVIYTQPLPFNRDRLIVQLLTVTAVVLAIVMGLSVFFKVETITVTGADTYSPWAVREASGISEGDNLLTFSKIRAASQIMANLPYVKGVRIGIKLPDTVNIMIEEESVVYAIKSGDGQWWLMDSNGRVVEQGNNAKAAACTQVLGVTLDNPVPNEQGIATEITPTETNELGEVIPVTTTGAQRLTAALQILRALEDNDIVGDAASVDVTSAEDIILWYGTRYQVNLGDSTRLDYKVACMNDAILQMSDYQSGVLDISFTIWPNQVGYTPFG
ncbi:MAG: FtsQ-type POTRA domain-containing protein [Firmicutes bacterium]|nr:FtsQ-type POTRA domain-containing protein [Bacillota bacterium]